MAGYIQGQCGSGPPAEGCGVDLVMCPEAWGLLHPLVWTTLLQRLTRRIDGLGYSLTLYSVGNL